MLLETLRCENGSLVHLSYHQERLEKSLRLLQIEKSYDLRALVIPPAAGIYRCRFLYNADSYAIEFHPYTPKTITSLKLVTADSLDYALKYSDRENLNHLFDQRGMCDDVLIVKNGLLTDTTIANIALQIEGKWLTPNAPLLMGTTRTRLLKEGFLTPASLHIDDIAKATKIAIMNAMLGFIEVQNGIIK
ncbi:aminotransferase class IV [Sulfuricurvum sp.]|uniref:aminotransferase class IV n=1 Tax=Sulfuricurvum sp. TaxID=2025608 RepID=UPI003C633CB8